MMVLEIHLHGSVLDRVPVPRLAPGNRFGDHLKKLMSALLQKHKAALSEAGAPPVFVLSGVLSCMNHFKPLRHPQDDPDGRWNDSLC